MTNTSAVAMAGHLSLRQGASNCFPKWARRPETDVNPPHCGGDVVDDVTTAQAVCAVCAVALKSAKIA